MGILSRGRKCGRPLQLLRVIVMEDEGSERSGRSECVWRGIPLTLFSGRLRIIDLYRGPRMRSILPSQKGVSNDRDSDHHVAIDFRPRCLQSPGREKKSEGELCRGDTYGHIIRLLDAEREVRWEGKRERERERGGGFGSLLPAIKVHLLRPCICAPD